TAPHVTGSRDDADNNALPPSHSVSARRLRERRGVSVLNLSGEKIDSPHVTVPQATTTTLTSRFASMLWKWDTLQRFVHMSLVAAVGILFFVYPMVVEYSTDVLDCVSIETSPGVTMRVMRLDPSVNCDSNEYTNACPSKQAQALQ
ncbi:transmembrane protein, putative, partial [Bodo saltans]